jgi:hypothetical protein
MLSELIESLENCFPSEIRFMGKLQHWRTRRPKRWLWDFVLFDV